MAIAALDPAAGWVAGIVGVHPWELAYARPAGRGGDLGRGPRHLDRLAVRPAGGAKPVDGGYVFNGRWQFCSGTDHCDWIFLGALLGDADGNR